MTERLLVEVVRADEVREGDRAWVRGRWRTATRIRVRRFGRVMIWWDGQHDASVEAGSPVLRVVPGSAEPTDAQVEAGCGAFERVMQNPYVIEDCVRAVLEAAREAR